MTQPPTIFDYNHPEPSLWRMSVDELTVLLVATQNYAETLREYLRNLIIYTTRSTFETWRNGDQEFEAMNTVQLERLLAEQESITVKINQADAIAVLSRGMIAYKKGKQT